MSRVLQYKSVISKVINQVSRARQESTLAVLASKNDSGKIYHRKENFNLLRPLTSNIHTSSIFQNQEPLQTSTERSDDEKQPSSQHDEEFDTVESRAEPHIESERTESREGSGRESVIDRLRRLSMTPVEEYEPSALAQQKASEMAKVRAAMMKNGEQWKWDQRNLRQNVPPPRQYGGGGYNNYNNYGDRRENYGDRRDNYGDRRGNSYNARRNQYDDEEEDDDFGQERRSFRDHQRYDNRRPRSFNPRSNIQFEEDGEDGPESYEAEMQKLRERLEENKAKKAALEKKTSAEDIGTERRNSSAVSSSGVNRLSSITATKSYLLDESNDDILDNQNKPELEELPDSEFSLDHQVDLNLAEKDPETFGTLSFSTSSLVKDRISEEIRNELLLEEKALSPAEDNEEEDDARFIPPYGERWSTDKLINKVRELLEEKKLKEAVDLYLGVLKEGGFHFDNNKLRHHFVVLINECADVGYVEMAFRLHNLMKKRGYKDSMRSFTCLFNACANSPWEKEANLERIDKLLINMKDRGREPNLVNYHALIKAYGRLGETVRAFHVVDKMIEESKLKPVTDTFNMLLQACITDTKNGFRYALITWRKLLSMKRLRPDIYSYNLLLRAVKDCGIEFPELALNQMADNSRPPLTSPSMPLLPPIVTEEDSNRLLNFLIPDNPSSHEAQIVLDSLGEPTIVDMKTFINALSYPTNRMAVLGGVRGILSQMVRHKVGPNLKTLTALLQVSRSTDINDVLQLLKVYKIKPDLTFFTAAIKQCYTLNNDQLAQEIVKLMNNVYHLTPNIVTWSTLGLGCRSWPEAKKLLSEMETSNFRPEIYVFSSLLSAARKSYDPRYILHVLEETRRREIPINEKFILSVDNFIKTTQKALVAHEMGKQVECKNLTKALETNPEFGEHFGLLKMRYRTWIHCVDVKIDPNSPWKAEWQHFKENKRHIPVEADDHTYESLVSTSTNPS